MPPFLKLDISDIPALLGAYALGPTAGVIVVAIKNIVHLSTSSSAYVGELANFLAGAFFVGTAGLIYKRMSNKKGIVLGFASGTLAMTLFTSFFNYFFLLDFYSNLWGVPMEKIVAMTAAVNGLVSDVKTLVVFAFVPFNLFKGILLSFITGLLYWRLEPLLKKSRNRWRRGLSSTRMDDIHE